MLLVLCAITLSANANVIISEVMAGSNLKAENSGGDKLHNGDWFEITNTGASSVTLTGWKWVDDKADHTLITIPVVTLEAGESIILLEEDNANDFATVWGLSDVQIITKEQMDDEFHGLSKDGDFVKIFDSSNTLIDTAEWSQTIVGVSYDFYNDQVSAVGIGGAYSVSDSVGTDVASPGVIPEPATIAVLGLGGLVLRSFRRKF